MVEYEATRDFDPRIDTVYRIADGRRDFHVAMTLDLAILRYRPDGLSDRGLDDAFHGRGPTAARIEPAAQGRRTRSCSSTAPTKSTPADGRPRLARQRAAGFSPFVIADD